MMIRDGAPYRDAEDVPFENQLSSWPGPAFLFQCRLLKVGWLFCVIGTLRRFWSSVAIRGKAPNNAVDRQDTFMQGTAN